MRGSRSTMSSPRYLQVRYFTITQCNDRVATAQGKRNLNVHFSRRVICQKISKKKNLHRENFEVLKIKMCQERQSFGFEANFELEDNPVMEKSFCNRPYRGNIGGGISLCG